MKNRWSKALVISLIVLVAAHIIFVIIGNITGNNLGIFNIPMLWAHWSRGGFPGVLTGIVGVVVLYFIIYSFCTDD